MALAAVVVTMAAPFVSVGPAQAAVSTTPLPSIPNTTTTVQVGQTGLPSDITLVNNNTAPNQAQNNTFTQVTVTPSCGGGPTPASPPCSVPDPGVFVLHGPGIGRVGTACAGRTFDITPLNDATGSYLFSLQNPATPITLTPPGTATSSCSIDFTADVAKAPAIDAQPGTPGIQTFVDAAVVFTSLATQATNVGFQIDTILPAAATLSTQASTNSTNVQPGASVTDAATVAALPGTPVPTGTVTYTLIGPNPNATCTAPVVGTNIQPVGSASAPFVVTTPGTYNFVATYSGDPNYAAVTTPVGCGVAAEMFAVAQLPITLTTQASTNSTTVPPGTAVTDQASLTPPAGGPLPTGTVTYTLVGPNPDATCTAPVFGTSPPQPVGAPSPAFNPTAPGTYNFLATYSGDVNYAPITTPVGCGAAGEIFAVARQPVTLTTQSSTNSATVAPGTVVTDAATVVPTAAGPVPTGTVTYTLVGPNPNVTCSTPIVGSSTVPVGSPSGPFTVTAPGTYNFIATYSGDLVYTPITTPVGCGVPAEQFAVALRPIGLSTQASTNSPTVAPGTAVTDTATFTPAAGAPTPTGTVTYTLVGPNPDATCTAPLAGPPNTQPVGTPSAPFTVTAPGVYNFVATYSGDANFAPIPTPVGCNDPNERFTVARQVIPLATQASTNATTVVPGTTVTDTATLTPPAGGPIPTGTVTYTLVGPNPDVACTAPVVGSSTVAIGSPSGPFTVVAPGTYNFLATYSGDAFYAPITTPVGCGAPAERFVVAAQPVAFTTQSSTNSATVPPAPRSPTSPP